MEDGEMLSKAIRIAMQAHERHVDKVGRPALLHALRVMLLVPKAIDIQVVAVLHDVVEDSTVTLRDLADAGFSKRIVDGVDAITRRLGEKYAEYIEQVRLDSIARDVKLADLEDHLADVKVMDAIPSLRTRYERAWQALRGSEWIP